MLLVQLCCFCVWCLEECWHDNQWRGKFRNSGLWRGVPQGLPIMVVFYQWFVLHLSVEYWNYNEKTWRNTLRSHYPINMPVQDQYRHGMGSPNTVHNRRYGHPKGPHILPIWAAHRETCGPHTYIWSAYHICDFLQILFPKACHYTARNKAFTVYCYSYYIFIIMWCYWLTDWLTDRLLLCSSILYVLKQIHCAQMFISSAHTGLFLCCLN